MKIQPRGYKRNPVHTTVLIEIQREIERQARRFNVSKSWVVAVALAEAFGIKIKKY